MLAQGELPGMLDAAHGLAVCQRVSRDPGGSPLTDLEDAPGTAALLHETARALRFNNRFEEALPLCQQALGMARRLGLVEIQAEALATIGILPNQEPEAARQALREAIQLAESSGLLVTAARANLNLGGHFQGQGRFRETEIYFRKAREQARRIGIVAWEFDYLAALVEVYQVLGDLKAADQCLEELRDLVLHIPNSGAQSAALEVMDATQLLYRGDWAEAANRLESGLENVRQRKDANLLRGFTTQLGIAFMEIGRLEQAERVLIEAVGLAAEKKEDRNLYARFFLCRVYLLVQERYAPGE
jgi:tetratricopeptide (TPR) repeat protein